MPLFDLRQAGATYNGQAVLSDITLGIEPGERVALVGRSGAGKSTLLRLLYEQRNAAAAWVPQDPGLVRMLSVFHNTYMGRLHMHSVWYNLLNLARPTRREVDLVRRVLDRLGLEDKMFTPTGELSGGQQQRTAVARAVHQERRILLADEPVSAVDEHQSRLILDAIGEAHETVVLAMHDVELALAYSDRVIGLNGGRIVLDERSAGLSRADLAPLYTT